MKDHDIYQYGILKYYQLMHPYIFVVQDSNLDKCHHLDSEIINTLAAHDFKMTLSVKTLHATDIMQKYIYTACKHELFSYFDEFDDHIEMLRPDLIFGSGDKNLQKGILNELFKTVNTYPKRVIMLDDINGAFLTKLISYFPEYYKKLPQNNIFKVADIERLDQYYEKLNQYDLNFTLENNNMSFTET